MSGKAIIFSAPSGSGKTTIVKHLLLQNLPLEFSVSACSRKPRSNEEDGRDYFFLSVDEFRSGIKKNEFIEWEEVYENHFYGTLKTEVERIWDKGKHVVFDVDVVGGVNLKNAFGKNALAIFVQAPSPEILEQRLRDRSTDPDDKIRDRIAKASTELEYAEKFDEIIINDKLEEALKQAERLVNEFLT